MKLPPIRVYWLCWSGILGLALIVKGSLAVLRPKVDTSSFFLVYIFGIWFPIMFVSYFEGRAVTDYLKSSHRAEWEKMTSFLVFGTGWNNGFRFMSFIRSPADFGDPEVHRLKVRYRSFFKFTLTAFFAFPIAAVLLSA